MVDLLDERRLIAQGRVVHGAALDRSIGGEHALQVSLDDIVHAIEPTTGRGERDVAKPDLGPSPLR
jgi:hypothetical protein